MSSHQQKSLKNGCKGYLTLGPNHILENLRWDEYVPLVTKTSVGGS